MRTSAQRWDEKAPSYPRFGAPLGEVHKVVLRLLDGTDGASIIDVGAGTGVFCLHLAARAAQLAAVDVSAAMLGVLRADFAAAGFGCALECHCCDFAAFRPAKRYDIALSTLSPALGSEADFAKFHALAGRKIYASWRDRRRSSLLDPLLERFGGGNWSGRATVLEGFLRARGVEFARWDVDERKCVQKPMAQAFEDYLWHLKLNGLCGGSEGGGGDGDGDGGGGGGAGDDAGGDGEIEQIKRFVADYLAERADRAGFVSDEVNTYCSIYSWH